MYHRALILLAGSALTVCGCKPTAYMLSLFMPQTRTVKAECPLLAGKRVMVVVFCDRRTDFEHPQVRLTLSAAVAGQIGRNVKDAKVVAPQRVVKYQEENIYWDEQDKADLGKSFEADYVLYISLLTYSMRDPGTLYLYRGRIAAEVSLFDTSKPERQGRVWKGQDLQVIFPEEGPTGVREGDDRQVRVLSEQAFADKLVKKFYDHEVDIE